MSTVKSVIESINEEYKAIFPKSHTYISRGFGGSKSDDDAFCLVVFLGDKESFSNNIEHNDILRDIYWIHKPASEDGKYIVETDSKSFTVRDETVPYTQCRRVKTGWRKKNQTVSKLIPAMRKHFLKVQTLLNEEKANIDTKYHKFM